MTCTRQDGVSQMLQPAPACLVSPHEKQHKFPDIIHFFFRQNCRPLLEIITLESLQNLQADYFKDNTTHYIEELKRMVPTAAHNTLMALFLLLVNVDVKLKRTIWDFEEEQNYRKIERFLMDLKTPIIAQFCINDSITIPMFVDSCWEAYVLA
jgi:hypothetical protein